MSVDTRLIVFGGLPGTGKTSVARAVADRLGATFIRLDSIEVAIRREGVDLGDSAVGYTVANSVATDQLRGGRPVVVDAVNPVRIARQGWEQTAAECGAELRFVHVVLGDAAEHRRRVESRTADLEGQVLPTWEQVDAARHDQWSEPHLELDNSSSLDESVVSVLAWLRPTSADERVAAGVVRLGDADAGELLTLQLATWVREAHENRTLAIPTLHEGLTEVRESLARTGLRTWGLRESGRLIAMVRLSMTDESTAFLGRLGVAPDLYGQGLGAAMLRFVEAQVLPGTTRIELVTGIHSLDNHAFYERKGYRITARDPDVGIVHLAKELDAGLSQS